MNTRRAVLFLVNAAICVTQADPGAAAEFCVAGDKKFSDGATRCTAESAERCAAGVWVKIELPEDCPGCPGVKKGTAKPAAPKTAPRATAATSSGTGAICFYNGDSYGENTYRCNGGNPQRCEPGKFWADRDCAGCKSKGKIEECPCNK